MPNLEIYNESKRPTVSVEAETIDRLLFDLPNQFTSNISLVWIDVQGFEGYVFLGAKQLLQKGIPVVCEIWPYGIIRSGMTQSQFCSIASETWTHYWTYEKGQFSK